MQRKDNLSREVFEVHIQYTRASLEDLKNSINLIFHKLDQQEKTLLRNTVTVEEHKKRSVHIEKRQNESLKVIASMQDNLTASLNAFKSIETRLNLIEEEINPIKKHVAEVKKITALFSLLYDNKVFIFKVLIFLTAIVAGIYYGLNFEDLVRMLK